MPLVIEVLALAVAAVSAAALCALAPRWPRASVVAFGVLWPVGLITALQSLLTPRLEQTDYAGALGTAGNHGHTVQQVAMVVVALGALVACFTQRPARVAPAPLVWGFGIFVGGLALASAFAAHPGLQPSFFAATIAGLAVLKSGATIDTLVPTLRHILRVYVWGSLIAAVVASGWAFSGSIGRSIGGYSQLVGLTTQQNALGATAAAALLLEVHRVPVTRWRGINIAAAGTVLLLTQSRAAWVMAAVGMIVLGRSALGSLFRAAAGAATVGAFAMFLLAPEWVLQQQIRLSGGDLQTFTTNRTLAWRVAIGEWHRSPTFGYGQSFLDPTYRRAYLPPDLQWVGEAHNQGLQFLAEAGIVGLVAGTAYLLILVSQAARASRLHGPLALALVAGVIIRAMVDVPLTMNVDLLHLVVLAVVSASLLPSTDEPADVTLRHRAHVTSP